LPTAPTSPRPGEPQPLSLFTAPRVDYSLHRLRHYTGTAPEHFQNFVLFTNYQFYIDEFMRAGPRRHGRPGQRLRRLRGARQCGDPARRAAAPQAADALGQSRRRACRKCRPTTWCAPTAAASPWSTSAWARPTPRPSPTTLPCCGPHAWIMLGHCAGLRNTQQLGDYVLAHGYVREDHVLDEELPLWVPIPALAEIQVALEQAVADVTQVKGADAEKHHAHRHRGQHRQPQLGTAARQPAASAASARAARWRWTWKAPPSPPTASASACPTARLLCVSDKPLHGEIKLPGMANHFLPRAGGPAPAHRHARAWSCCAQQGVDQLHSRKLRSFAEVAFQ